MWEGGGRTGEKALFRWSCDREAFRKDEEEEEMNRKIWSILLVLVLVTGLVLAACGPTDEPTVAPTEPPKVEPTEEEGAGDAAR